MDTRHVKMTCPHRTQVPQSRTPCRPVRPEHANSALVCPALLRWPRLARRIVLHAWLGGGGHGVSLGVFFCCAFRQPLPHSTESSVECGRMWGGLLGGASPASITQASRTTHGSPGAWPQTLHRIAVLQRRPMSSGVDPHCLRKRPLQVNPCIRESGLRGQSTVNWYPTVNGFNARRFSQSDTAADVREAVVEEMAAELGAISWKAILSMPMRVSR